MDKFIEKVSTYQFLNYMIPGTLFLILIDKLSIYDLNIDNILLMLFGGYCTGMVLSRIGSLPIEHCLKKWRFVVFAPYNDFKNVEAKDSKLTTLSAENNMYRTFLATFLILAILYGLNMIHCVSIFIHTPWMALIVLVSLTTLFLFAYRKQTSYVRKSVEHDMGKKDNELNK